MATWAHQKEFNDFAKLTKAIEGGPIWVHRPLVIHERNETRNRCKCCGSSYAIAVEEREHIDILIDPATGIRRVLQRVKEEHKATWWKLAKKARKVTLPHRVSRAQLAVMQCDAKVVAIFGGVRGGKTSFIADTILSAALMHGGEGAQVWWVAPTQDKTNIGLNKLAKGEVTGKGKMRQETKPLIPEILLRYVPKSPKSDNNYIELIDGTKIWFSGTRRGVRG
jgi:hypothetical protein